MIALFYFLLTLASSFFLALSTYAETANMFLIQSSSFENKKEIPALYTCDGKDLSPQLAWSGAPANTKTFALICEDPDAPAGIWYHWVLYNIPNGVTQLAEGSALPAGAALGKNSWGRSQYNGPCPPASSTHRYQFTLYALDAPLALPSSAGAKAVLQAIQGHTLGKATMMGVFGH